MPIDGGGFFTRLYNFQQDRDDDIRILASRMDGEFDNVADALNTATPADKVIYKGRDLTAVVDELYTKIGSNATINVKDYYPAGAVPGTSASADKAALNAAITALASIGGRIVIPPFPGGNFKLSNFVINPVANGSGTRPIVISGVGWGTTIEVAEPCVYLFDMRATMVFIEDFDITDPNGYCTTGFFRTAAVAGRDYPSGIRRVTAAAKVGSQAAFWINDGGRNVSVQDIYHVQNMKYVHLNIRDGVNNEMRGGRSLGCQNGCVLDGATDIGTQQAEGFLLADWKFDHGVPDSRGFLCKMGLAVHLRNVQSLNHGPRGIGYELAPDPLQAGKAVERVTDVDCYWEGSYDAATGIKYPSMKARGNTRRVTHVAPAQGTGGYGTGNVNGIDYEKIQFAKFIGVAWFFGAGDFTCKFVQCEGLVVDATCDFGPDPSKIIATRCTGRWASITVPAVGWPTMSYPVWYGYNGLITSQGGDFGSFTSKAMKWRRDGSMLWVAGSAIVNAVGAASGPILVQNPLTPRLVDDNPSPMLINNGEVGGTGKCQTRGNSIQGLGGDSAWTFLHGDGSNMPIATGLQFFYTAYAELQPGQ